MKSLITTLLLTLFALGLHAQRGTVTGKVTDAATGETLPGATIVVDGTTGGTSTDRNGTYTLPVEAGARTLLVSYIGYATASVSVTVSSGQTTTADVALEVTGIRVDNSQPVTVGLSLAGFTAAFNRTAELAK